MVLQFSLSTLSGVGGWSNNIDSKLFVATCIWMWPLSERGQVVHLLLVWKQQINKVADTDPRLQNANQEYGWNIADSTLGI
jgi:hypothetical protein